MNKYLAILLSLGISSCTVKLFVKTDPEFGTIYVGDKNYGKAPICLIYKIDNKDRDIGYITSDTLTARWVSGATSQMLVNINCKDPKYLIRDTQEITIIRPSDYPNVNLDANFVNEMTTKQLNIDVNIEQ